MMSELGKKGSEKRGVGLGSTQDFALRSLWSTDPRESRAGKRMTESKLVIERDGCYAYGRNLQR